MRLKSCKRCGSAFETDRKGAYLCPSCAAKSKRESVYRERICMDCGITFLGYPKSKRCPSCQASINRKRDTERHRSGSVRKLGSTDICASCGQPYTVESGTQRYCQACAPEAVRDNINSHKRQYMADNAQRYMSQKAENRSYNKICVVCGKVFNTDLPTVTCSAECAEARRKIWQHDAEARRSPRKHPKGDKLE